MKTVAAVVATFALFAAPTFASPSVKFVAANDNIETQVCVAAATQGLQVAEEIGKEKGLSKYETRALVCNGRTIASFSRKHQPSADVASIKSYTL
ncbi:hypothetical protein K0504_02480 [Neiella marina]|uniref:DUF3718 domain-containing protein n=1 Tax=Neiella holothuriorum TaxID=2870530 RepID=A0ABS7EC32_9GAMM|nr:hypothetical protein [Neiella holothuriorum]MBW8189889.1 hypothetical protein [Neiella holothuriorum]